MPYLKKSFSSHHDSWNNARTHNLNYKTYLGLPFDGMKTQVSHTNDLFNLIEERREELCRVNSQHNVGSWSYLS